MKKLIILVMLLCTILLGAEELSIYSGVSWDANGYETKISIIYSPELNNIFFKVEEIFYTIYLGFGQSERQAFIFSVSKMNEWEKTAKDNSIADVVKDIEMVSPETVFHYGDWHNAGKNNILFRFFYSNGLCGLSVIGGRLSSRSNQFMTLDFPNMFLFSVDANKIAEAISDNNLKECIELYNSNKQKEDELFK